MDKVEVAAEHSRSETSQDGEIKSIPTASAQRRHARGDFDGADISYSSSATRAHMLKNIDAIQFLLSSDPASPSNLVRAHARELSKNLDLTPTDSSLADRRPKESGIGLLNVKSLNLAPFSLQSSEVDRLNRSRFPPPQANHSP